MGIFGKKRKSSRLSEEEIQDEIRKRILKAAQKREDVQDAKDSTKATLDALEGMVSLSREEMEKIAKEVRKDFSKPDLPKQSVLTQFLFPWAPIILIVITFFLMRRGSSWTLIAGIILAFTILNLIRKSLSDSDDDHNSKGEKND